MRPLALMLVVAGLAACTQPVPEPAPDQLDGEAAWQRVYDIVYEGEELRPRHPGHPQHNDTADWLADAMQVPGWEVAQSFFSGRDYIGLDKPGAVASYTGSCSDADKQQLPGLWFTNLAATWPGQHGLVVLGAHWDAKEDTDEGHPPVPGANDGASGVGLLLEMQRLIADQDLRFPFTLRFVFFDGEDGFEDCHPLAGSIHYVATQDRPDRFILLDMVGDADARFPREGRSVGSDPELVDLIWSKAPAHGLGSNFVEQQKNVIDDHVPFIEAGVPSVDIIDFARTDGRSGFPPYWHTAEDTPDKLEPEMLGSMGSLLLDVLQDPQLRQWP